MTFGVLMDYLRQVAPYGHAVTNPVPEEVQRKEHMFAGQLDGLSDEDFVELPPSRYGALPTRCRDSVQFSAFLDGVQRTVIFQWIPTAKGAVVPLHVAEIAAALIERQPSGSLSFNPRFSHRRFLIVMPWEGLRSHGKELPRPEQAIEDTDERVFQLGELPELIFCDTTFEGISLQVRQRRQGGLEKEALYDSGKVRSRAQARVAVMRQVLELLVLANYRSCRPDAWVLVDGPLFLLDRWHRGNLLSPNVLRKSVGYIKSLWRQPVRPDVVLQLAQDQRTPVLRLRKEPKPKTGTDAQDEQGTYRRPHLEWYLRMRVPTRWSPPGPQGLVRMDIEISTLGLSRSDTPDLTPEGFERHRPLIDAITMGVWRERWPAPPSDAGLDSFVDLYPVSQLEKVLQASLQSRRALAYAGYRTRGLSYTYT